MRAILKDSELFEGLVNGTLFQRENQTESYVSIPNALVITDDAGAMWTLGNEYIEHKGRYHWNVVRNGVDVDEFAEKMEFYRGQGVYIYGRDGKKHWTGTTFI